MIIASPDGCAQSNIPCCIIHCHTVSVHLPDSVQVIDPCKLTQTHDVKFWKGNGAFASNECTVDDVNSLSHPSRPSHGASPDCMHHLVDNHVIYCNVERLYRKSDANKTTKGGAENHHEHGVNLLNNVWKTLLHTFHQLILFNLVLRTQLHKQKDIAYKYMCRLLVQHTGL